MHVSIIGKQGLQMKEQAADTWSIDVVQKTVHEDEIKFSLGCRRVRGDVADYEATSVAPPGARNVGRVDVDADIIGVAELGCIRARTAPNMETRRARAMSPLRRIGASFCSTNGFCHIRYTNGRSSSQSTSLIAAIARGRGLRDALAGSRLVATDAAVHSGVEPQ